ncbi:phospholipase D/nuclease [Lindgomyces ingoldianus]|uniref:Phospholipase D/nuclease n=1 Tax=Lindgomyces ingoldianus TaxID=673940 RepID=A0ACB6RF72_9PLEO|nr:phospholipase D/nuclease [Lindgomyces ingoldianus]KAF2477126.1 phospholipase D/nuclease [Lindgomyces ingoldianus]
MPKRASSPQISHFNAPFLSTLNSASKNNIKDDPNYYALDSKSLVSTSTIHKFETGTGSSIYLSLAPLLESTSEELILVTLWIKKLGLPDPSDLPGLDVNVKSIFLLPFSVMHPKFIIVDRRTVVLPSCNISWEEWFEGCITFSGPSVGQFVRFYSQFWERREMPPPDALAFDEVENARWKDATPTSLAAEEHANRTTRFLTSAHGSEITNIPTVFLPSPHRRTPHVQPFATTDNVVAPPTPLNVFVLTLLSKAEKSIQIQTPNLTSPPILSAILKALSRGIDIRILTSEKLMVLEQLVTAGTTTKRCIRKLVKRYNNLSRTTSSCLASDEEAAIGLPPLGRLHISYFTPLGGPKKRGQENGEPQQSHLKMMIVDDEVLVLGSGNLDRASWFTSQELGVAFFDQALVERVRRIVHDAMIGRVRVVFDS